MTRLLCALLVAALIFTVACTGGGAAAPTAPLSPLGETAAPTPQASPKAFPTGEETPEPVPKETEDDIWQEENKYLWYASGGLGRENIPANPLGELPEDVRKMIPLTATILCCRGQYDLYYDDLKSWNPGEGNIPNQHSLENGAYTWAVLTAALRDWWMRHPDCVLQGDESVLIPQQAARDFVEICFGAYTPDFFLPKAPPANWVPQLLGEGGQPLLRVTEAGDYCLATGNTVDFKAFQAFLITGWGKDREGMDTLSLCRLSDTLYFTTVESYTVTYAPNENEGNALGLPCRIEKIVQWNGMDPWTP